MTSVLDSSAVLALLHDEPGAGIVATAMHDSLISAVNWGEVAQKTLARGADSATVRASLEGLGLVIVPFDAQAADGAADLWAVTSRAGLSLADRACLQLARSRGANALTGDRAWSDLHIGVDIRLFR